MIMVLFYANGAHATSWENEPSESIIGIHLLSEYGSKYRFISKQVSSEIIQTELGKLDWKHKFYQFVVVIKPGISMEVGGSLNQHDGLSAMYRNRHKKVDAVIISPPTSVNQMAEILLSFIKADGTWKEKYAFEFVSY